MKSCTKLLLIIGVATVGAVTLAANAEEEQVTLDQVPPAVKATIFNALANLRPDYLLKKPAGKP